MINKLDNEMIWLILGNVDEETLVSCKSACHKWNDIMKEEVAGHDPFMKKIISRKFKRDYIDTAAAKGYLKLIKWARANGCPWNEKACSQASGGGHLEVLQ